MALRDQPYLPLYIQDVLTDEKLVECSAEAHGVYFRLLCMLHKQDIYGEICLKQKHKQNKEQTMNFAIMLAKQMPFTEQTIYKALRELIEEKVMHLEGDILYQKRMVKDGKISIIRAEVGKTGGSSVTKQYGKEGFLYWIGNHSDKNKVGISVNPKNRLYRLRCDFKDKGLEIIETIAVKDMGTAEDAILQFFQEDRDGEWINLEHEEMEKKFVLFKAKIKANPEIKYEDANTGIKEEGTGETIKGLPFNFDTTLPSFTLEAVERNQFAQTGKKNTDWVKQQWDIFILERINDPPLERVHYKALHDLTKYFLNWIRNKFPKNGTDQQPTAKSNGQPGVSAARKQTLTELRANVLQRLNGDEDSAAARGNDPGYVTGTFQQSGT